MQQQIDKIYDYAESKQSNFDFSADKRIDINNLHTEIQIHSEKCFKYNARRAKLQAVVNQLEELKKQTRSSLMNDCVANPTLCDPKTSKYTDKKAEIYYRLDSGYKEVITALLDAKHELDCMAGMQRIIEEMKWDLKDLVVLSMSEYFDSKESKESRIVLNAIDSQYKALDKATENKQKEPVEPIEAEKTQTQKISTRRRSRV